MRTINRQVRIFLIIAAFIVAGLCFNDVFGQKEKKDTIADDSSVCESVIDINITSDSENKSVIVILNGELLAMATPDKCYSINYIVVTDGEKNTSQINVKNAKSTDEVDADPELEDWMFDVVNPGNMPDTLEKDEEIKVEDWMTNLSTWTVDG